MILGAGQLGSRHLQALKGVSTPLDIYVVDPSEQSLRIAKDRFDTSKTSGGNHKVNYLSDLDSVGHSFDIAIVATNSDARRTAIEKLSAQSQVAFFILEKLLFQRDEDYSAISRLLHNKGSKAWVNCTMRYVSFYANLKPEIAGTKIHYNVYGSNFGLVTNAIHYLDHIAYLTECVDFVVDTSHLSEKPIESKRKGFLEFNGVLKSVFADGSEGNFVCSENGDAPVLVQIFSEKVRFLSRENEGKAWIARSADNWRWNEIEARVPYQSEMTGKLVEGILMEGTCPLVDYEQSAKIHMNLLRPLLAHLNQNSG
ncbi:MAG: oxidoreductase, partial [Bacteroidota bacterium]